MEVVEKSPIKIQKRKQFIDHLPILLLAIFIIFFLPTFDGLYSRWIRWDESLSHGLLVNGVFVYLLYKSLPWELGNSSLKVSTLLIGGLMLCSFAWFFFHSANIYILEELLLLPLLIGFYASIYGIKTIYQFRLLLLLPIFTIPVWDQLTPFLVNLSGLVVGKLVQITSIPAVIEGNSIFIPFGQIVIADGCSGLRYFEIALALAYIIGLLNNYDERKLLPALLIAATLGLVANWLRIFILVLIGYETKMQSSLMANHEYFGWALFGIMCLPAVYWAPVITSKKPMNEVGLPNNSLQKLQKIILPICALGLGPLLNILISEPPVITDFKKVLSKNFTPIPENRMPLPIGSPSKSFKEVGVVEIASTKLYVQIDQYQRNVQTDKLVPYIAKLYNSEEWMVVETKIVDVASHKAALTIFRRKASDYQVTQLQWFEIGSLITTSITKAKLLQIPALVSGANNFKIVTLQAPCEYDNCNHQSALLISNAVGISSNPAPQ